MRTLIVAALALATQLTLAADSTVYQDAVANPARTGKDRERDARELPGEVLEFAGIKPGMKVADIFAGGGYYSELLSYVVGPKGEVLAVNNPAYFNYEKDNIKKRYTPGRLANVKQSTVPNTDLKL